jgi:hypothetical protein
VWEGGGRGREGEVGRGRKEVGRVKSEVRGCGELKRKGGVHMPDGWRDTGVGAVLLGGGEKERAWGAAVAQRLEGRSKAGTEMVRGMAGGAEVAEETFVVEMEVGVASGEAVEGGVEGGSGEEDGEEGGKEEEVYIVMIRLYLIFLRVVSAGGSDQSLGRNSS